MESLRDARDDPNGPAWRGEFHAQAGVQRRLKVSQRASGGGTVCRESFAGRALCAGSCMHDIHRAQQKKSIIGIAHCMNLHPLNHPFFISAVSTQWVV